MRAAKKKVWSHGMFTEKERELFSAKMIVVGSYQHASINNNVCLPLS